MTSDDERNHQVPVGTTESIDIGGRRLNVWRAGTQGPVVLLIHGIPTNHLLWHDVVPALEGEAQLLAVDMLGYGWSDSPGDWQVDLASQAGHLLSLLDVLGIDRVTVVGHDLGGGVAQILATTSTDRIDGMAVVNGVCFDGWPVPVVQAMKATWPALRFLPPPALAASLSQGLRPLFAQQDRARAFIPRFLEPWRAADGPQRMVRHLRSLDSIYTETVSPFLPRLSIPVEVVWGRRDHQMKPRYGERLAKTIPTAELTWVEDASHFVPADTPAPLIEGVRRLLARVAGHGSGPSIDLTAPTDSPLPRT